LRKTLIIYFFFAWTLTYAQQPEDDINVKEFNQEFLEELITEKVNTYLNSQKLPEFKVDKTLYLAAEDQANYMLKVGKAVSSQLTKKKSTPFDRVAIFEGFHSQVAENDLELKIGAKARIPGQVKSITLKSYENIANYFVQTWIKDKKALKHIKNPLHYKIATAISLNKKEKILYVAQVYASEPYILPAGESAIEDNHNINPYNKEECDDLDKKYSYLPELMSDNIFFEKGNIYFYFHDLELLKGVMASSKDAIAIDVVTRNQFSCETGNKLYPSKIHKGFLLPPIYKTELFKNNELAADGALQINLGAIPSWVDTNNVEFNLLIIKNNCLCQTVIYNSLQGENLRALNLDFAIDTLSISHSADSIMRKLEFTIPFERNKSTYHISDIKPFLDSLNLNQLDLKTIEVVAYSSIEGEVAGNEKLQQKRAKSILKVINDYGIKNINTIISTKENWDGFYKSLEGSPYEKDLLKLSKEQIRAIVNSDSLDYNLEPYLEDQRKAKIIITLEKIIVDSALLAVLPSKFSNALKTKNYLKAMAYQSIMFKNVKEKKLKKEEILKLDIPFLKETVSLNNNLIAFKGLYNNTDNKDSLYSYLLRDVKTQLMIDPMSSHLKYNKVLLRLLLWSNKASREKDPKYLLKELKSLYTGTVESWKVNQLLMNYHLIAADFYYEKKEFSAREKALKEVKKILLQSQLNRDQIKKISDYFIFQMRINWAVEIMLPWAKKETIDEDFLFTFLTIAIYNKKTIPTELYISFLEKAKRMNKERFCKLFGFPNMSFQLLQDLPIKNMYCNTCN